MQTELEEEQEELRSQIRKEQEMLYEEEAELQAAQKKNERNADSVTGEMFAECQELLEMFGLPYIIAPMEAEAQCAYLDTVHLVDGVVTDDCDVFLFGGLSVYKNIFDDRKYVETYYMKVLSCLDLGLGVYSLSLIIYPSGDQWNIYSFRSCFNSSPCLQDAVYLLCE